MVAMKNILVTGGNTGIGFALCKQLALQNHHVFLTARTAEKGRNAVAAIQSQISATPSCSGQCEFIHLDVTDDSSVLNAMEETKGKLSSLKDKTLYGLVNNAGVYVNDETAVIDTNLYGTKRVTEAFLPLLNSEEGSRIVNLGSGSGPMYVSGCSKATQKILSNPDTVSWEWIEEHAQTQMKKRGVDAYGLSKALISCYTGLVARENPNILVSAISPGFIDTQMTRGWGATKTPDEGTLSIHHCLFKELEGNGWYYGSDAIRSPYHFMRNPGEPKYDGVFN